MRPSQLLTAVVALTSVTAATSNIFDSINALADVKNMFVARQDDQDSKTSEKPSATGTPSTSASASPSESNSGSSKESSKPTETSKDGESKTTGKATGSASDKATKTTGKPKTTTFGNTIPPGGVQMVTPNPIMGPQYYKVGDWITFAWNYTSLKVTPTAVDVLASCSANAATYTVAVNQSVQATGKVLWDTGSYKDQHPNGPPFLTETYTLLIYDAQSSVSAIPQPGYLAPYKQFTFGMYEPQPYVPWAEFKCANCNPNSALSPFEKLTLKALAVTSATTVVSLLYFAASFGVW